MSKDKSFFDSWDELKSESPEVKAVLEEAETISHIITLLVKTRVEKGMSQRDLAKACGYKQSTIARIESCAVSPRLDTLAHIARVLGLKMSLQNQTSPFGDIIRLIDRTPKVRLESSSLNFTDLSAIC